MSQSDVPPPAIVDQAGFIHLPIRIADYIDQPGYHPSTIQKLRNKMARKSDREPQWIAMTHADYTKYWAKDDAGHFAPHVREPPQGRVEWLRYQVRVNDEWRSWGQIRTLANSRWSAVYW